VRDAGHKVNRNVIPYLFAAMALYFLSFPQNAFAEDLKVKPSGVYFGSESSASDPDGCASFEFGDNGDLKKYEYRGYGCESFVNGPPNFVRGSVSAIGDDLIVEAVSYKVIDVAEDASALALERSGGGWSRKTIEVKRK
jgi:hypothetical protein